MHVYNACTFTRSILDVYRPLGRLKPPTKRINRQVVTARPQLPGGQVTVLGTHQGCCREGSIQGVHLRIHEGAKQDWSNTIYTNIRLMVSKEVLLERFQKS